MVKKNSKLPSIIGEIVDSEMSVTPYIWENVDPHNQKSMCMEISSTQPPMTQTTLSTVGISLNTYFNNFTPDLLISSPIGDNHQINYEAVTDINTTLNNAAVTNNQRTEDTDTRVQPMIILNTNELSNNLTFANALNIQSIFFLNFSIRDMDLFQTYYSSNSDKFLSNFNVTPQCKIITKCPINCMLSSLYEEYSFLDITFKDGNLNNKPVKTIHEQILYYARFEWYDNISFNDINLPLIKNALEKCFVVEERLFSTRSAEMSEISYYEYNDDQIIFDDICTLVIVGQPNTHILISDDKNRAFPYCFVKNEILIISVDKDYCGPIKIVKSTPVMNNIKIFNVHYWLTDIRIEYSKIFDVGSLEFD